jgi:hypothetical protein
MTAGVLRKKVIGFEYTSVLEAEMEPLVAPAGPRTVPRISALTVASE